VPITLIENFRAVFYAPFYAAFALGAYEDEGVEVEHKTSPAPSDTAKALLAGGGDVAWGGPMRVLVAGDADPACGLVSFCEVVRRDPFFIVGRGPAPGESVSELMEGLMDKRVATVSEVPTPWMCLQNDLRRAGADPGALDRIADQSMAENAAALRAGEIDAAQVFEPLAAELTGQPELEIWYAAADRGLTTYTTFNTTRAFILREPDALLAMTRAMHRTQKWIASHDAGAFAECIVSYFPDLPREILTASLGRYLSLGIWNDSPVMEREGYDRLREACISGGLIRSGIPYGEGVDMRFAEAVSKENPAPI
jgi:NitT/TauT family transport system substrate-binding protein